MLEFFRVRSTRLGTRVRTLLAQLVGVGREGTENDAAGERVDDAEVLQPIGIFVRPGAGTSPEAVCVRLGDEVVVIGLIDKTLSVFTDVAAGETRMYGASEPTARIRLREDGSVDVESKAGTNVRLNGGALSVARQTDTVSVTFTPSHAGNIIAPAGGGNCTAGGNFTITGTITSGAPRVKA